MTTTMCPCPMCSPTHKTIWETFKAHRGRQIDKWFHYFAIYEKHLAKYVGTDVRLLEIGVDHGGSLQMWKSYFGPKARIVGLDINPLCKEYEEDQIDICTTDQCDPRITSLGEFDIIIDDGSHVLAHQSITYRHMWPKCLGVYLIEDCQHGYPLIEPLPPLYTKYPWVIVCERAQRIIKGEPSHELRPDEVEARKAFAPKEF